MTWTDGYWHLPSGPERVVARDNYYRPIFDRTDWLVRFCDRHGIPLVDCVTAELCDERLTLRYGNRSERLLPNPPENVLRLVLANLCRPLAPALAEPLNQVRNEI